MVKFSSPRLILHPAGNRHWNMAVDEALLRLSPAPVLRMYSWTEPGAVSIGYFQNTAVVPAGRPFVRRYTGGGLVDHARDFTYTLVLPKGHPLDEAGTSRSYEAIHAAVADALQRQGFAAELAPCCADEDNAACFQKAVKYDVVIGPAKAAGAAQRRSRTGTLHQGSILLDPPFDRPSLAQSLAAALATPLGGTPQPSELTAEETALARELETTRYATDAWNLDRS